MKARHLLATLAVFASLSCSVATILPTSLTTTKATQRARDFLCDDSYSIVNIQVSFFELSQPRILALEFLSQKILKYCHKDSVYFTFHQMSPKNEWIGPWDSAQLTNIHTKYFDPSPSKNVVSLHLIYVPLYDMMHPTHIACSVDAGKFIVIYQNKLIGLTNEKATLLHELGHVLGLVNNGTPMKTPHEFFEEDDPKKMRSGHCRPECVMYWRTQINEENLDFDGACRQDLQGNGGR